MCVKTVTPPTPASAEDVVVSAEAVAPTWEVDPGLVADLVEAVEASRADSGDVAAALEEDSVVVEATAALKADMVVLQLIKVAAATKLKRHRLSLLRRTHSPTMPLLAPIPARSSMFAT